MVLDLIVGKFLAAWSAKPMYVFGGFGLLCLALSSLPIGLAVLFQALSPTESWQKDFVETPLPVIASVMILVGFLGLLMGLLAEMLMRTYFESRANARTSFAKWFAATTSLRLMPRVVHTVSFPRSPPWSTNSSSETSTCAVLSVTSARLIRRSWTA